MGKLTSFTFTTLNGFFEGPQKGDTSWHSHGAEEGEFAVDMVGMQDTLLFGRITYEHMVAFWPTPEAAQHMPALAAGMNSAPKIVFSTTMQQATWNNTELLKGDLVTEIRKRKQGAGHITLLGSGSILTQLAEENLIDEYQLMIDPVAIGKGTSLFEGLQRRLDLELIDSRVFESGVILLRYQPRP